MDSKVNETVLMNRMVVEVVIKPCPWCKETPDIRMPISDDENTNGTWLWSIKCINPKCKMNPESPHIAIRGDDKVKFDRLLDKIDKLATYWNEGNELKAKDKKVIDLTPIQKRVTQSNYNRLKDNLNNQRLFSGVYY